MILSFLIGVIIGLLIAYADISKIINEHNKIDNDK